MFDVVIRASNLGKVYLIGHESQRESYTALRDVIGCATRNLLRSAGDFMRGRQLIVGDEVEEFWALKDVSFEIKRGEVVGIIGRNGAGKSTLLKILSRITEPSAGRVEIIGRVASLLEVGTGFHPELTGRENIYLNGAILGMTRSEIRRKFEEIVDFAEVEKFLDTPVKRYSSGMYVRLAFAVAAHLEPDILVVDEVLAVGDVEFQKKCLGKMQDVASNGRTVLFVSHNVGAIQKLCGKCLLLKGGSVAAFDATEVVLQHYAASDTRGASYRGPVPESAAAGILTADIFVEEVRGTGGRLRLKVRVMARQELRVGLNIRVSTTSGSPVGWASSSELDRRRETDIPVGESEFDMIVDTSILCGGMYSLSLDVVRPGIEYLHRAEDCLVFEIMRTTDSLEVRAPELSWGNGAIFFPSDTRIARVSDKAARKIA
jgi:lipopolysaccharide transport system ATP-binding protein